MHMQLHYDLSNFLWIRVAGKIVSKFTSIPLLLRYLGFCFCALDPILGGRKKLLLLVEIIFVLVLSDLGIYVSQFF